MNLIKVIIPDNSNLQAIEENTFTYSKVRGISIQASVKKVSDYEFYYFSDFQISEESKLESLSKSVFHKCDKIIITIPSSLKK